MDDQTFKKKRKAARKELGKKFKEEHEVMTSNAPQIDTRSLGNVAQNLSPKDTY